MAKSKGPMKTVVRGQAKALGSLQSISAVLEQQTTMLQQISAGSAAAQEDPNQNAQKQLAAIKVMQAQLELQKDQTAFLKRISDNTNKQIEIVVKGNKDWKGVGDRFKDMQRGLRETLDPDNIKKAFFGNFSMFKGARNKVEDIDFVKRMQAMGDTRSKKELRAAAAESRGKKENLLRVDEQYQRMKKSGASDDEIKQSNPEFWNKRFAALKDYKDSRLAQTGKPETPKGNFSGDQPSAKLVQLPSDKGKIAQSTTDILAEDQTKKEQDIENLRLMQMQTDLLQQIANNTAAMSGRKSSSAGGAEDTAGATQVGGGAKSLAASMDGVGKAMGSIGKGGGSAIGGAIGGIFSGIMEGIATGIKAFANPKVLAGVVVLGLITAVVWGMSKALEGFQDLEWETLGKAGAVILGLIAAGAGAGALAPMLGLGALALTGLGGAVWVIGKAMETMGSGLEKFTESLLKLQDVDGAKLTAVANGLKDMGLAFAAFGAGQAAEGFGNLVSRFLTIGTDSPVERLIKIGQVGPGVMDAARGLTQLGTAMKTFTKVDSDSMKGIKEFPWDKATAFVAAGGSVNIKGTTIEAKSKEIADGKAKQAAAAPAAPVNNTVNTQQNNNTTNTGSKNVRNTESSYQRYLQTRY